MTGGDTGVELDDGKEGNPGVNCDASLWKDSLVDVSVALEHVYLVHGFFNTNIGALYESFEMHDIIRSVTSIPRRRPNDITTGARRHVVALGEPIEVRPLTHVFFQGDEGVLFRTVSFIEHNVAITSNLIL